MTRIDMYKEMWTEASDPLEFKQGNYNLRKIYIILDMAQNGIIPDGTFSDDDVCMWSTFRQIMRQVNSGDFVKDAV